MAINTVIAPYETTWDCQVNSNAATTVFSSNTGSTIVGAVGAHRRRVYMAFPVRGIWGSVHLNIIFSSLSAGVTNNAVFYPIVSGFQHIGVTGNDISWDNIVNTAPAISWSSLGAEGAGIVADGASSPRGHFIDTTCYAVFPFPVEGGGVVYKSFTDEPGSTVTFEGPEVGTYTSPFEGLVKNPTAGSLVAVFNRADAAARAANSPNFIIAVTVENENDSSGTNSFGIALSEHASIVHPLLYGTLLTPDVPADDQALPTVPSTGKLESIATILKPAVAADDVVTYQIRKPQDRGNVITLVTDQDIGDASNVLELSSTQLRIILPPRQKFQYRTKVRGQWSDWVTFKTRAHNYRTPSSVSSLDVEDAAAAARGSKRLVVTNNSNEQITNTRRGATVVNSQKEFNNIVSNTPTDRGATIVVRE